MIYGYNETFVATGFLVKGLKTIFTTAHSLSGAEMVELKFPGSKAASDEFLQHFHIGLQLLNFHIHFLKHTLF